jgi:parvulin-like peptidyl-prolyl isomerase
MKRISRFGLMMGVFLFFGAAGRAEILATVGLEKIDDVEFNAKAAAEEHSLGRKLSAEERQAVLKALINQRLLVAKAREEGFGKKEELKRSVEDYERQLLSNIIFEREVSSKASVSEAEVKAFYEGNQPLFELRQVSQILVQPLSADKASAAEKEAVRLKAKVAASPKSFAEVAKSDSDDPASKERGGDLGQLRRGMLLPELEKAVFDAKPGSIIGPLKTQFGWHILYVKSAKKQTYDEAKEVIAREIGRARTAELQQKLLDDLAKKYKVSVHDKAK